jgi:uncharacterized membrane protein (DUF373 family)
MPDLPEGVGDPMNHATAEQMHRRRPVPAAHPSQLVQTGIGAAELGIYLVVAGLLVVAVTFTALDTVKHVIDGARSRQISDTGVFILDRVLLMFIIAELLYTLRLVNLGGRILVEPFLFIGLIAVVRRVLVITAEFEARGGSSGNFVTQIAALSGLAVAFTLAIYLFRRSERREEA